jgi:hypothetical protein
MVDRPLSEIKPKTPKIEELEDILNNDKDLVLFFLTWLKNGQNGTRAYLELHPKVNEHSARVLASRTLARVNIKAIMEMYDVGPEEYFLKLKEGLNATKVISARVIVKKGAPTNISQEGDLPDANSRTDDFVEVPDYAVRKQYHDKVGKLLEIEKDSNPIPLSDGNQFNQFNFYSFKPEERDKFNKTFDEWFEERYGPKKIEGE